MTEYTGPNVTQAFSEVSFLLIFLQWVHFLFTWFQSVFNLPKFKGLRVNGL
jgi:hypothetical protein